MIYVVRQKAAVMVVRTAKESYKNITWSKKEKEINHTVLFGLCGYSHDKVFSHKIAS